MSDAQPVQAKASVFFNRCADLLQGGMFSAKYFEEVIVIINTLRQIAAQDAAREAAAEAPALAVVPPAEAAPVAETPVA
jgi:hypothetical protein